MQRWRLPNTNFSRGEALKAIESLGRSSAAYEAAKERLERKFGGERRRIALRLEEIDSCRPKEIDRFADFLDLLVINLKVTGQHKELGWGSLYVKTLKKMTERMIMGGTNIFKRGSFIRDRKRR